MNLRTVLLLLTGIPAFGFFLAIAYFDAHLWTRRDESYSLWDVSRFPSRWFRAEMYTEDGNRYRRLTLRCAALSLAFFGLYALVSHW